MNVSRRWLEAMLGRPLEVRDLVDRLARLGAPVDAVREAHPELADVVVARVEEVRPHPGADRLHLCAVDDGSGALRGVVCGAANVRAGGWYPFARVGVTLPGGLLLARRKIRGEVSDGMLCSARELGLGEEHEGLLELAGADYRPGMPFRPAAGLDDHRLEVDVTPNRPDLLGHKGIARELAASYRIPFRLAALPGAVPDLPAIRRLQATEGETGGLRVAIEDPNGCGRFLGAVVRGVTVGPSPEWLRRRLEAVGLRPINGVVDATNYVLAELGQPMHAYDLATLGGPALVARSARAGERVVTLDGADRALRAGDLVIADAGRVIGIAGVMGGQATEVGPATRDVFLECAWFVPARVRATRTALGLATEASFRFERGVDRWNGAEALTRCVELILRVAGGSADDPPVDLWPDPAPPPRLFLRRPRVAQVLGIELPARVIEETLVGIGATVVAKPEDDRLAVEVPGWRPDLRREIDLIEEVARGYGYDRIPSELRPYRPGLQRDPPLELMADRVRGGLAAEGLLEAITLPLGPEDPAGAVRLYNPPSSEQAFLRRRLLPGLVREVERNWDASTRDVRLFEIGTAFLPSATTRPTEAVHVALVVTGGREPGHWSASGRAPDYDRWDLKGLFQLALSLANPSASVQVARNGWRAVSPEGTEVGWAGPVEADAPKWAAPLWGLELALAEWTEAEPQFRPYPSTPAVERDLALLLPAGVDAAAVLDAVRAAASRSLESVTVVDEYHGPGIPEGRRGLAIRLVFRDPDRTLRDAEVEPAIRRLCGALERAHDVVLRTT